jgi:hypothetical protein
MAITTDTPSMMLSRMQNELHRLYGSHRILIKKLEISDASVVRPGYKFVVSMKLISHAKDELDMFNKINSVVGVCMNEEIE